MSYNEWFQQKRQSIYDTERKIKNEEKEQKCRHLNCSECHGTGRKNNGQICIHMISCPCPKCSPSMLICRKAI